MQEPPVWRVGSRGRCVLLMLAGMAGTIVVVATGGHPACPGGPAREVSEGWSDSFLPSDQRSIKAAKQRRRSTPPPPPLL